MGWNSWAAWLSNSDRRERFVFSQKLPDRFWRPPSLIFNLYRDYFTGLRRFGREVDHSYPSSVVDKNEWSYTSIPPLRLQGVGREIYLYFADDVLNEH